MLDHQIDIETYMVAPVLRDRLFRVSPFKLVYEFQTWDKHPEKYLSKILDALINIGFLTPVLIDTDSVVIAGQGLVEAAAHIGLDDIPALRLEELSAEERRIYIKMMHHFFNIAGLNRKDFLVEAQHIFSIALSASASSDGVTA